MNEELKNKLKTVVAFVGGVTIGSMVVVAFHKRRAFAGQAMIDLLDTQSTGPRLIVRLFRKNGKALKMTFSSKDTIRIVDDLFEKLYPGD